MFVYVLGGYNLMVKSCLNRDGKIILKEEFEKLKYLVKTFLNVSKGFHGVLKE